MAIPGPEGDDLPVMEGTGGSALDELLGMSSMPGSSPSMPDPVTGPSDPLAQFPQAGGFVPPGMPGAGFQPPQFGQAAPQSKSSDSNRTLLIALCCLAGVALVAIVGLALFLLSGDDQATSTASSGQAAPSTAAAPSIPAGVPASRGSPAGTSDTAAKPLALAALNAVTLDPGGRAAVELRIERNGREGVIQIQVEGLPQGVVAQTAAVPAGQSVAKLELSASDKLGENEVKADARVTVKVGDAQATQPLAVTVKKLMLPRFQPVANVVLQPGTTATVNLTVERNGHTGPLELRLEGSPPKMATKVGNIPADQSVAKLELTVAPDAPDGAHKLRAVATVSGRIVSLDIPLQIDRLPFRVNSLRVITLKPGEKQSVQFPVQRRSYQGPFRVEMQNLPDGVTIPKTEVAAGQGTVTVELTAAAEAKERVRTVKVVSTAEHITRTDPLIVRVSKGEGGFLPNEVVADPEIGKVLRRGGFGGRITTASKRALMDAYGGTPESEDAVLKGLRWLAVHQQSDGRWSLKDYSRGINGCNCKTKGEDKVVDNDVAGTAFGLLPFLGAGITTNRAPDEPAELAKYQKNVREALRYLRGVQNRKTGELAAKAPTLYAHALGTMALAEAYGLSGDEDLRVPAQMAIKYLVDAQDPKGGGWKYAPKQPGDMSSTGWMFLAIRYGQLAGLAIRREPLIKAERFVESCAAGPEDAKRSQYSYVPDKEATLTMTAAGLLTRQYLGWDRDRPDLAAGCKFLMQRKPPETGTQVGEIYYYYYATQVLHHMEGEDFDLWNYLMREHLIRTQQNTGHAAGSWSPEGCGAWAGHGGRLYATSLALTTLQVYYRHLPMYRPVTKITEKGKEKE